MQWKNGAMLLRWLARLLSVLLVSFIMVFVIGEAHLRVMPVIRGTHGMCLVFPFGLCLGVLLAWRWELAGSLLALVSTAIFSVSEAVQTGKRRHAMSPLLFALPAVLFLVSWAWGRTSHEPGQSKV